VTYPFGRPTPWTAEHESMLPEDLQDWSLVGEE
jgi:hypothetical protein